MAKKGQIFKKYSAEFKLSVILDMRENHLSYRETIRKYWNATTRSEESNHTTTLRGWERKYLEEGFEGLMKDNRGKGVSKSGKPKGRRPKLDPKVEEDLIAENQRLRMEIEYLKKLSALVLAEEQKNGKKRS